jgi:hypothetical protein
MIKSKRPSVICSICFTGMSLLLATLATAQTRVPVTVKQSTYTPPKTPDGQPNIEGVYSHRGILGAGSIECGEQWDANANTGHHNNFNPPIEGQPARSQTVRQADSTRACPAVSKWGTPYDGVARVPLHESARAKKTEMFNKIYDQSRGAENVKDLDPSARCLPVGPPRQYGLEQTLHQILQRPGQVLIFDEQIHEYHIIYLDGRPHLPGNIRLWQGDSRGHWDGNTLIVETTNYNDKSWLDFAAMFHSESLRTIERFTIVDADTIDYEITFDDPQVFSAPWKLATHFDRVKNGDRILEEECLEGNRLDTYGFR